MSGLTRYEELRRYTPLRPGKDTGPDEATRKKVYARDGWRCICGCNTPIARRPHSVGHRKRRSQGGGNELTNLLTFLGLGINPFDPDDHHARIDSRKDPRDEDRGLTVRSKNDPALIPVILTGADGIDERYWLTPDGRYDPEPPEGVTA